MAQVRIRKRSKTYSYIFEAGQVDGKRKVVEKGGFPTKDAAYKAGVAAYNDFLHGNIGITSERVTVKDFITSWLQNVVAANVKPTTMRSYVSFFNNHVAPPLGNVKVQELTPALLDKWIRSLHRAGLSHGTLSDIHGFLHHALDYAVYPAQLIQANPLDYIKIPKKAPRNITKRTIITPAQFNALLVRYPFGAPFHIPLVLLYHTGMRISEVFGLMWRDIDFESKTITLNQQLTYIGRRGYFLTTLKTESSYRFIIMDETLAVTLIRWREQQAAFEQALGDTYVYVYREDDGHLVSQSKAFPCALERTDLVCTYYNGRLCKGKALTKALTREGLNSHSFRHTHATRLIEGGASPKAVAGRLGHANIAITQNLYTHNTVKMQAEAVSIFEDFLQTQPQCRQTADNQ